MLIDPIYYAVFFDINLPATSLYAMNKRITESQFKNIADGLPGKNISLDGKDYQIINTKTFNIINTVDNHIFIICEVKKIT